MKNQFLNTKTSDGESYVRFSEIKEVYHIDETRTVIVTKSSSLHAGKVRTNAILVEMNINEVESRIANHQSQLNA